MRGKPEGILRSADGAPLATRQSQRLSDRTLQARLKEVRTSDLELFLLLVETGSYAQAHKQSGHSITTIRAHISQLEYKLGELITGREKKGFLLTPAGERVLKLAANARASWEDATRTAVRDRPANTVRIAVTEGLGAYWLGPQLDALQEAHPELVIDLHCDMDLQDVASGEFDLAFQLVRPETRNVICNRIATLHLMPFTSDQYLREAGIPRSVDDWRDHKLVWQKGEQIAADILPYYTGTTNVGQLIRFTTNSSVAHFRAVARGRGIGFLPTYARAISRRVRPIDLNVRLKREVFCVINSDSLEIEAVRIATQRLQDSFSGERYPWFRDDFVHPEDFEDASSRDNVVRLFHGFVDGLTEGADIC